MIRPSRAHEALDPVWLARAVALLQATYPRIKVTSAVVDDLREYLTWQWRLGRSPREAVAQTCAVSGRVVPSAATEIVEPIVRPPAGAKPGDSFGAESLRVSVQTARLERRAESAKARAAKLDEEASRLEAKASRTRSTTTRERLGAQAHAAKLNANAARDEAARLSRQARESASPTIDPWRVVRQASPPSARRTKQAASCPPGQAACKLGLLGGLCGLPAVLVLAGSRGSPIPQIARFCLASADRLIPSHDARRGFVRRTDYPEGVQEREYHREKSEQMKVLSTAQNLIPELIFNGAPGAIDGLPVVTKEGIVLGGNGRTQALQLHYAQGGQLARDYLLDHAAQFGFSRSDIEQIADPVVVRVIDVVDRDAPTFQRAAQELVRLLNIPLTQSLSQRAEAVAESRRLTDEVLEILSVALSDDQTLSDYLGSRSSRTLADAMRRASILTERNASRLITSEGFTEDGKRFVERLLTAALLPDAELLDRLGAGTVATLAAGAPWLLGAAAAGPEWDLRKPLGLAARDLADLRGHSADSVDSYLRQGGIFGKPASIGNLTAESLLRFLYEIANKPTKFRLFARRYAALAATNPVNQSSLFPTSTLEPGAALQRALEATR